MEDYEVRLVEEYRELEDRISKIADSVTRYKRGELEFRPRCLGGMIVAQLYIMQDYANILLDRIKAMGLDIDSEDDSDDAEPEEEPLPPEPQSHGFFIPRDGSPYLILHDADDTWSAVKNKPGVMSKVHLWTELPCDADSFSGYCNWKELVQDFQDSAFPLIPLNFSSMSAIAKALADND